MNQFWPANVNEVYIDPNFNAKDANGDLSATNPKLLSPEDDSSL